MVSIKSFFKYSIHIGHSSSNSIFLSSWFFYKLRKKIWIINLFKTIIFIKLVFKFLKYVATFNLPFWFINLELSKEYLFKKYALSCGEFACTKMWIRGFLSNFKSIQRSLVKYVFKKHFYKFSEKENLLKSWSLTRFTWPRGAFLSNIPINYVICKEAASILLPVVALVDTNIKSFLFTLPVPSNDDSIDSINFILSLISKKLLLYKYKKVLSWYQAYKNTKKKKILKSYMSLKNYLNTRLKKLYRYYKHNKKLKSKKHFFFTCKKKYQLKTFKLNRLTKVSKNNLRKFMFSKKFWNDVNVYSKWALIKHKKFKINLFSNFLNKSTKFFKNSASLIKNRNQIIEKTKGMKSTLVKAKNKTNYLTQLNLNKLFYRRFLKVNKLNLKQNPLYLYAKTIKLKYMKPNYRKRVQSLQKLYYYYYYISNNLRKSRIFHETFFRNLPSRFTFIRSFHKYDKDDWWNQRKAASDTRKWYWYNENYRYLLNDKSQQYWSTNRRNTMLLKYWKYNKKLSIADSAFVVPLIRWISDRSRPMATKRAGRFLLKYWLIPMFSRFSVKEHKRNKWYSSRFFWKEDNKFLQRFNWNRPAYKTPLTTFHYYNSWFSSLLKDWRTPRKRKFVGANFQNLERWRKIKNWRAWKRELFINRLKRARAKRAKLAKIKKEKKLKAKLLRRLKLARNKKNKIEPKNNIFKKKSNTVLQKNKHA